MVSLVSPTGSDTDEPPPQVFSFPRDPAATPPALPTPHAIASRAQSARRASGGLTRMLSMDVAPPERNTVQRKLHKSVSFQSDLPQDEEEDDVFSRRPAFPASLIIPRVPSTAVPNSTAASSAPSTPASPAAASAPPPSQQHVPKIVDPATPRGSYSPPGQASRSAEVQGRGLAGQRPSSAGTAALAGNLTSGADREGHGAGDESASQGEKGRASRKRVMFRSRSASLRGSEEDHTELKEKTGSRSVQSSHASGQGEEDLRTGGAASDKSHTTSTSNAGKQQRGLVVTLTERQGGASSKAAAEERARGGGTTATHRPTTAGGNRVSNGGERGKREEETGDGNGGRDDEGEEIGPQKPEFKSAKEKECWELYQRMCDKGLTVSYDTILRGMLTPTEYRMRRNALLSTC
ncbi:translation initiation factor IF-2 isoform X2 [Ischnura elegans]|uniref:translation initiation factor IF-2 isoform X2 n=1 Tax=Ischnura elegans TaxID=197161 RepID=UPI001ED8BFF1|nr:translation initiation factor IF-2 isoform X2 [Ischnura elegans]